MSQIVLLTSEELSEENKLSVAAYMRQKFTEIKISMNPTEGQLLAWSTYMVAKK